jgi:sugar phosphate isomerase/epimerase
MLPSLDRDFLMKIRAEMDRRNLTLANLCVDGPYLWVDDREEREQHHASALQYIAAARVLGARTIRIDMGERSDQLSNEAFDYVCKTYLEYAKLCHDEGMRIGPENHWGASRVPAILKSVRDAVSHPGYGQLIHFDNFAGDIEEGYAVSIPVAMHAHVGTHTVPVAKSIIRRMAAAGYSGAFSVESYSGEHELERAEWQLGAVRSILAEVEQEGLEGPGKPEYIADIYRQSIVGK